MRRLNRARIACAIIVGSIAAAGAKDAKQSLRTELAESARSGGYSLADEEWWNGGKDGKLDAVNFEDRTARKIKLKFPAPHGLPACASRSERYEINFHPDDGIWLSDDNSGKTERIDKAGFVSKQCFSPDDAKFVFSSGGMVKIYEQTTTKSVDVAAGSDPTWSPDGKWIGFNDGRHYVLMDLQTKTETQLFRTKETLLTFAHGFGVRWSPDSKYVTYTETGGSTGGFLIFGLKCPEPWRIWVWRVADGAHDWVYQICKPPRLFWWVKDSEIEAE